MNESTLALPVSDVTPTRPFKGTTLEEYFNRYLDSGKNGETTFIQLDYQTSEKKTTPGQIIIQQNISSLSAFLKTIQNDILPKAKDPKALRVLFAPDFIEVSEMLYEIFEEKTLVKHKFVPWNTFQTSLNILFPVKFNGLDLSKI